MVVTVAIFLCLLSGVVGGIIGAGAMMIVFFPELKRPDSLEPVICFRPPADLGIKTDEYRSPD